MRSIYFSILLVFACHLTFAQISITESNDDIVIDNYGIKNSYPKEGVHLSLRPSLLEIQYDGRAVLGIKDYTDVTTPSSSSFADLFANLLAIVNNPVSGGGGIEEEVDPVFTASPANGITAPDITSWNTVTSKANTSSPTFTGAPSLPTGTIGVTQTAGNSTTALATTAFVTTADNLKANINSQAFTGNPSLPTGTTGVTQTAGNSTTALATTAFVTTADNLKANLASPTFTGTVGLPSTTSIGNVSSTEIGYVDGVTGPIQTQIDTKSPINAPSFTTSLRSAGTLTIGNAGSSFLYNTSDETTNYERGALSWSSNIFRISTEKGGSGSNRDINIVSSGQFLLSAGGLTRIMTSTTGEAGGINVGYNSGAAGAIIGSNPSFTSSSGIQKNLSITPTINQTSTAGYSAFYASVYEQATGSGVKNLIDLGTNSAATNGGTHTSKFSVSNLGVVTVGSTPAMSTKPGTVLVSDNGVISTRTNAQHYADITEVQNFKRTAFFEATGNGTATSIVGLLVSTQGTTTTRNVAATNFYTGLRKLGYVGATTANAPAGLSGNNAQFQVARGFSFRAVFSIQSYDAGHRYFVGMGETTDNTVDPSALVNRLHMYADPGDVTWKIRGANASQGTAVDLGANFPVNTSATDVYDVTFNCEPGATTATYLVRRLNTGDTASGTISTVPGAVLIRPQVIAGNAATGTAASIDIARVIVITEN